MSDAQAAAPVRQRAEAAFHRANALWKSARHSEAAELYRRVLRDFPGLPSATLNLGNALLAQGEEAEGWTLYQARRERRKSHANRLSFPEWQGEPLERKRLFIWSEQGLGDQIFAARYVPNIRAEHVTMVAYPALASLFAQLPAVVEPMEERHEVSRHAFWTLPLSLPQWVAPAQPPYLSAEPLPGHRGRIGVMWRGNQLPDPNRSLPEPLAKHLLDLPGAVSLQPEATGAKEFLETARIIAGLDLVVTIDTSVAHLAGAMGKPGIVLLQTPVWDWRWREGEPGRSHWYPSLELLRQPSPGDWAGAVEAVISRLEGR